MKKKWIILTSILVSVLAILLILFGFVFVLRRQTVTILDNPEEWIENASEEDIISVAGLKNGKSIFMLDKDKAIENIETKFPYIKVVQIKTASAVRVEIVVRRRHEMFYYFLPRSGTYYILDEDLKVLNVIQSSTNEPSVNEPTNLIKLDVKNFGVSASTKAGDFVGQEYSNVVYNFVTSVFKYAEFDDPSTEEEDYKFLPINETRNQLKALISTLEFKQGVTADGSYNRLVLTTRSDIYGVKMDIGKPEENLEYKVNVCFATLNKLSETDKKSGTIKITYLFDGTEQMGYSAE